MQAFIVHIFQLKPTNLSMPIPFCVQRVERKKKKSQAAWGILWDLIGRYLLDCMWLYMHGKVSPCIDSKLLVMRQLKVRKKITKTVT